MSTQEMFKFRLFVVDNAPNSAQAKSNLRHFCNANLHNHYEIEVIDILQDPRRGLAEGIIMTPTLIKLAPMPVRRIIGTLSNTQVLRDALALASPPT